MQHAIHFANVGLEIAFWQLELDKHSNNRWYAIQPTQLEMLSVRFFKSTCSKSKLNKREHGMEMGSTSRRGFQSYQQTVSCTSVLAHYSQKQEQSIQCAALLQYGQPIAYRRKTLNGLELNKNYSPLFLFGRQACARVIQPSATTNYNRKSLNTTP